MGDTATRSGASEKKDFSLDKPWPYKSLPMTKQPVYESAPLEDSLPLDRASMEAGELAQIAKRNRRDVTLEDFMQMKPDFETYTGSQFRTKKARSQPAFQAWFWNRAFRTVSNSFVWNQLFSLAKEAGLSVNGKWKKPDLVRLLIKEVYQLQDPSETSKEATAGSTSIPSQKAHSVSRRELFLLLCNGGRGLNEMASNTGATLLPQSAEGQTSARDLPFELRAHGSESAVDKAVSQALEVLRSSIQSERISLGMPTQALEPEIVRYISSETNCAIEGVEGVEGVDSSTTDAELELSALKPEHIAHAKHLLASFEAAHHQQGSNPGLLSFASPSSTDPSASSASRPVPHDPPAFAFLPQPIPSQRSWLLDLLIPGPDAILYRLTRLSESSAGATSNAKSLVNLDESDAEQSLRTERNWEQLMQEIEKPISVGVADVANLRHRLSFGALLFPGSPVPEEDDNAVTTQLAALLSAPLGGSWPIDVAYQRLRARAQRPLWISGQLKGTPADADDDFELQSWRRLFANSSRNGDDISGPAAVDQTAHWSLTYRMVAADQQQSAKVQLRVSEMQADSDGLAVEGDNPSFKAQSFLEQGEIISPLMRKDVLAPELTSDLRLETEAVRRLSSEQLNSIKEQLASWQRQMYVDQGASDSRRGTDNNLASTWRLDHSPPMTLVLDDKQLRFESFERVSRASWQLNVPASESEGAVSSPSLHNSTVVSYVNQGRSAKTSTDITWEPAGNDSNEGKAAITATWRERIRQMAALLDADGENARRSSQSQQAKNKRFDV